MTDQLDASTLYRDLADRFADVGLELSAAPDTRTAFTMIAELGLSMVDSAEHASITVLRNDRFDTPTATSEVPPRVDAIQYELGTGPCVDAVLDDTVYRTGDLELDTRWPEFGQRAVAATGVHSMLATRLYCEQPGLLAALNLYASARDAFGDDVLPTAVLLATHASLALTAASRQEKLMNLEQAVASNREIGVAIGVLMSRHLLTQQQAFDLMRMASQRSHRKLREIAAEVVQSGDLELPR